jgi:hypothetical protein
MSRTLRTAALVVGAVALVATGVGAAAGLGAFGAGVTATTGTVLGVTTATIGAVASAASLGALALSTAGSLTAAKASSAVSGNPEQFAADPNAFIAYLIGRTATAGNIVWRRDWDTADKGDNDRRTFVVDLGLGPIQGIEAFQADQVTVAFNGAGQAGGGFNGFMWQQTQIGACPEPAALTFGTGAGTPPGWTPQHKLSGHAAASWTLRFDTKGKHYQNGTPAPRWIVQGAKVYDPRLDSTYPGGVGPCRALNEATYVYSECPYLHALTWALGRWQNGKRVIGIGAPIAAIDVAAFVEGANVSDVNGWKAGGVVYSGDGKWDVMKRILQAGMGEPMALGAKISCFVNAPKVVLDTITSGDIVGSASVAATQSRRDRFNTGIGRYRSEAHNWATVSSDPIAVATHVAEDGGPRTKELDYPLIQVLDQVGTAIRYDIENAREFGPITLPLKLRWMGYKPGDCLAVQDNELGLNGQPVLILNRDVEPSSGTTTLTARSETNAKHPFALGQTAVAPPTPGVTGPPLPPVPGAPAWAITATSIVIDGTVLPALVVEGGVDSAVADAIVFEYRMALPGQAGDLGWIGGGIEPPQTKRKVFEGVRPATSYEVAVSYRRNGQIGTRLIIGPVTIGMLAIDTPAIVPGAVSDGFAVTSTGVFTGTGENQIVTGLTLPLTKKARVRIDITGEQKFYGGFGPVNWVVAIDVDGTFVRFGGGDAPEALPTTFKTVTLFPGTHTINFVWFAGSAGVTITDPQIEVAATYDVT